MLWTSKELLNYYKLLEVRLLPTEFSHGLQRCQLARVHFLQTEDVCVDPELGSAQGFVDAVWVWLKINQEGLRRFWSMFPLARVPFWYRVFEPPPYQHASP